MSDVIIALNWVNDAIFVSLVNTTVQIAILVPLIALLIWMFRIRSATTRYSLWLFVLFAIIALPLITPFIPQIDVAQFRSQRTAGNRPDDLVRLGMGGAEVGELPEDGDPVPSVGTARVHANRGADVSLINPVSIAYFIWCAGAVFMSCMITCAYRKLRKLGRTSPDVKDPAALEMLSRLKQRIRVRRPVALKVSSEIYTPMSLGIFSPTIILPDGLLDNSPFPNGRALFPPFPNGRALFPPFPKGGSRGISELEMILTHELAHIKRNDYLVNLLQNMLRVVFFFHPPFHLMNRSLARECEHICDDWVILMTSHRSRYAECLIDMLERVVSNPVNIPVTLAMAERKQDIPGRIDMIVDKKRNISTKISTKALITVFLIGCLVLPIIGGIGLARFAGARPAAEEGRIVFVRGNKIWIMDAGGGNERQLTFGGVDGTPAWSPDGKQIAFFHFTDSPNLRDIYVMNADGGNQKRLTNGPENDVYPTWSPDGKRIAFERSIWEQKGNNWELKNSDIYVMNADGTDMKKLTESPPFFYGDPQWSPDGGKVVSVVQAFAGDSGPDLWVMDADGGGQKMLNDLGKCPGLSPDGRIAFTSGRDAWSAWETVDIYVMGADGSNVKMITKPDPASERDPAWSPDGAKIAFCKQEGRWDSSVPSNVYVMDADGSNVQQLTNTTEWESDLDWTAFSYGVEHAGKLKSTWGKIKAWLRPR